VSASNHPQVQPDRHEDVNVTTIIVIGLVSTILLVVFVVSTQALYYVVQDAETYRKDVNPPSWRLNDILLQQQEALASYRVVDPAKKIVGIPIDVAIKRYVERQATQPSG